MNIMDFLCQDAITVDLKAQNKKDAIIELIELLKDAKETLDSDTYLLFRKGLEKDYAKQVRIERIYRYITSQVVTKNRKFYEAIVESKGEAFARLQCYTLAKMEVAV